ncbi:hypothetical protein ONS95_003687 [Cadophora gregata]|uniref:uncharacterized protein n=1 Tax=Cadophora gregata TaxID=51156 RepID=UPI0026DC9C15|nr:uncharacterized protein ONS95_003687 [Cadophora gregata]KAK0106972.1 hypothetical protein ONS95_003687 [Cadophora gregata]
MPSLPALVMLFPIISAAESLVLFIHYSSQQPPKQYQQSTPPWWAFGAISASIVLLCNEYRLMVPGLVWGISGLLTIGVVRALLVIESWHDFEIEARLQRFHGFIIMTLLSGLVVSSAIACLFESPAELHVRSRTLGLMFVNIVTVTGTTFTGTSLLAYSPISLLDAKPVYSTKLGPGAEHYTSFASSILVLVATLCSQPATVVSWVQILMYLLGTLCVLRMYEAHDTVVEATDLIHQLFRTFRNNSTGTPRKVLSIGIVSFVFVSLGVALFVLESVSLASASCQDSTSVDSTYSAPSSFDIVISAYLEEPEQIKSLLDSLRKTAYLRNQRPNVILYTKDPEANIAALKDATSANVVKQLENVGREGGTYLHHIVTNWDSLAEKTMFIQAHAHNMRELLPKIEDYLVADTGMLSLGFAGVTCSCLDCQDRWGWKDHDNVIPTLYQQIYNQTCDSNTPILLSYKGQFVASAKRIRGISKSIYERLLLATTTMEGWGNNRDLSDEQSLDDPVFGFTMERIWGLVMQCATDDRVAVRCPSLLSGKGLGGDVRDCQCFDP